MAMEQPDLRSSPPAENVRVRPGGLEKQLLRAAEAGDAASQCNLGILYDNGLDDNGRLVDRNKRQALRWLSAAAEQGLARAQAKLAEIYAEGPDLCGDHVTACGWFLLAAGGLRGIHQQRAQSGYERIAAQLTSVQIAEAEGFAQNWMPQQPERAGSSPLSDSTKGVQ